MIISSSAVIHMKQKRLWSDVYSDTEFAIPRMHTSSTQSKSTAKIEKEIVREMQTLTDSCYESVSKVLG